MRTATDDEAEGGGSLEPFFSAVADSDFLRLGQP